MEEMSAFWGCARNGIEFFLFFNCHLVLFHQSWFDLREVFKPRIFELRTAHIRGLTPWRQLGKGVSVNATVFPVSEQAHLASNSQLLRRQSAAVGARARLAWMTYQNLWPAFADKTARRVFINYCLCLRTWMRFEASASLAYG